MTRQAKGAEREEDFAEIAKLERRHRVLEDQLHAIDDLQPVLRQKAEAEFDAGANQLTGWVELHMTWIDSGYRPDRRPRPLEG